MSAGLAVSGMKLTVPSLLSLGVIMVLTAGLGTFRYTHALESQVASARASVEAFGATVAVPVAARDISRGSTVMPGDFVDIIVPADHLPANVLRSLPPSPEDGAIVALTDLRAGELLLSSVLAEASSVTSFGFALSPDGRAFSVTVENLDAFARQAAPGDMVDLYWTRDVGGGASETRLLGSALRILAVPEGVPPPADGIAPAPAATARWEGNTIRATPATPSHRRQLILEGMAVDVARHIAAQQRGSFRIAPATGRLDESTGQWVIGPGDLAGLPLVTRRGETGAPAAGTPSPLITPAAEVCRTALIRAGSRATVEVPC